MIGLDGRRLASMVYALSEIDGHLTPVMPEHQTIALGHAPGVWSEQLTVSTRDVSIGLDVRPHSYVGRQRFMELLRERFGGRLLELTSDDQPGRVLRCTLKTPSVELYPGSFVNLAIWVTLHLQAVDPAWRDVEPTILGLSAARTACPIGTDTSSPLVHIAGACTDPAIVIRNAAGTEVSRTSFSVILGANDTLSVDSTTEAITRRIAGVVQTGANSGLRAYVGGPLPLLSPEDTATDTPLTVELTAASGTPTGVITYHRRW